jgi:hypothetical protein
MMGRHRQVSRVQLEKSDVLGTHPRTFFASVSLSSAMRVERLASADARWRCTLDSNFSSRLPRIYVVFYSC